MGSEKLDRNNFASWEYKMHQYLVGQGYLSYIKGAHKDQPGLTTPKYVTWEQAASCVMYCLATCVHDHMLDYIREAKTPKELNNIQQRDMSITTYTLKIKDLCDSLGSKSMNVDVKNQGR